MIMLLIIIPIAITLIMTITIHYIGEDLFGVQHNQYPALDLTKQELRWA